LTKQRILYIISAAVYPDKIKTLLNGKMKTDRSKRKTFLIYGSPLIEEEEIREVEATLRSGWIGTGPRVNKFETLFRQYIGADYAMALNSCTAALHLSMIAAGIGPGDEVITTPMTFAATANSIIHAGGVPVFVDISLPSMLIDPDRIQEFIDKNCYLDDKYGHIINKTSGRRVKAILPVHFAGRPCEMNRILEIATRYNLYVIEDAAHAIESVYQGQKIGNIGHLTCFSFYVTKNIVTGEGGMVTTNNQEFADKIKVLGLHGMSKDAWKRYSDEGYKHYEVVYPGFKYNMMDIQAALGIHQLKRVNINLKKREQIWRRYDEAFQDLPLKLPPPASAGTVHARHLYTILVDQQDAGISRDEFQQRLYLQNIGTGVHYIALHMQTYYKKEFGFKRGDFPNAEYVSDRTISLPLSAKLTEQDAEDVIAAVKTALK
jgi:dTDP-4-amino-4,6-dideoxygalactose transaminase